VKHFFDVVEINGDRNQAGKLYEEFLRVPAMSAGLYVLPAGAPDPQKPHAEDELYYVLRGRARMRVGSEEQQVRAGAVVFVEAGVEHRFYDIDEELQVLVFFAPAESG
jgi:mannose-6-phosphate isomerase-like protein (cupin superfamily)